MTTEQLLLEAARLISNVPPAIVITQCLCVINCKLVLQLQHETDPNGHIVANINRNDRLNGPTPALWSKIDAKIRIYHKKGLLK